ncbi:MAG: single-stranded DNA-binding protein [Puniceicoccales bacterium]|jgi:single-strand DNA-binding protein|nr:single-stranded DNA-binding protein [Puniceicoccales bacterium]
MPSFNKVILMGNLTRDPEVRVTQQGMSICKFTVATSRQSKNPDGTPREETTFVDIDAFGKQAEVICKYFTKGRPILLEGRLRLDQWETQTGEKRSRLGVVLESFQFIGPRGEGDGQQQSEEAPVVSKLIEDLSQGGAKRDRGIGSSARVDEDVPF